jgi:hypothetical protein
MQALVKAAFQMSFEVFPHLLGIWITGRIEIYESWRAAFDQHKPLSTFGFHTQLITPFAQVAQILKIHVNQSTSTASSSNNTFLATPAENPTKRLYLIFVKAFDSCDDIRGNDSVCG